MTAIRVYKDNLREHIFRTLFFTDTVLFFSIGFFLAVLTLMIYRLSLHITDTGFTVASIFIIELIYALVATLKIEKQPLYKIIPRAVTFSINEKHFTKKSLQRSTGDFKILGNYIVRKKKLIVMYEIRPYDIALLNDEERQRFYQHIKTMLHTLPGNVQFILRKERAQVNDYHDHFYSLFETANPQRDWLLNRYIKELSSLIDLNEFQIMKYYAVFSTPLVSENEQYLNRAIQKLHDMGKRFSGALALENIQTIQLDKKQLIAYFQEQFQNTV